MSQNDLQSSIRAFIAEHRNEMLEDLESLIRFPSVAASPLPGMPYGEAAYEAMLQAERIAQKLGFATRISDDCILTAEYGDRPVQLCLPAHLDVVDAGSGWTRHPYALTVEGDRLYGRGTADDKGPAIAALYAMKAARELCPDLPYSPQALLGTAEEIGSPDLKQYMTHTVLPRYTLTPDAIEPLVIGESGKHRPSFSRDWPLHEARPQVLHMQGGRIRNAIPGYAEATVAGLSSQVVRPIALRWTEKTEVVFDLEDTADGLNIRANGRDTHIGTPELGRNGQTALMGLLADLPLADCPSTQAVRALAKLFPYGDLAGLGLGLSVRDDLMGPSRTNFTVCTLTPTGIFCQMDSRAPTTAVPENYSLVIDGALRAAGFTAEDARMEAAHYVPPTEPQVPLMQEIYRQVHGFRPEGAFSIGASYAHHVEGALAVSAFSPGIDTRLHKADEFLPLADLDRLVELLTLAVISFCGGDLPQ